MAKLNVALGVRPNLWKLSGGDTIIVQQLIEGLRGNDHIELWTFDKELPDCDVAHLFNFALPQVLESQVMMCMDAGVPFIITPLAEDRSSYWVAMRQVALALMRWVVLGQPTLTREALGTLLRCALVPGATGGDLNNELALDSAALFTVSGSAEGELLHELYDVPKAKIRCLHYGSDRLLSKGCRPPVAACIPSGYALCVGRLEDRKNQLMLLYALQDSPVPLVFVTGNGTVQPEYAAACKRVQRPAPTMFIEAATDAELRWLMEHARCYVQPSWQELPGLATLEAAALGRPVVATAVGHSTTPNYLGWNDPLYCDPGDPDNMRTTVEVSMALPQEKICGCLLGVGVPDVSRFAWDRFVQQTVQTYEEVA